MANNNWYKQAQASSPYPYYIAHKPSESMGSFQKRVMKDQMRGKHPTSMRPEPSLELRHTSPAELMSQLRRKGLAQSDFRDLEFYVVGRPMAPRRRLRFDQFLELARTNN